MSNPLNLLTSRFGVPEALQPELLASLISAGLIQVLDGLETYKDTKLMSSPEGQELLQAVIREVNELIAELGH